MITKVRYNITKNGRNAGSKMAVFTLEDLQGQIEVVLFPDTLAECASMLVEDSVVFVKGKTDYRRERANILASELIPLEKAREKLAKGVRIKLDAREVTKEKVMQIRSVCQSHRGSRPLSMVIVTDRGRVHATADRGLVREPGRRVLPQDAAARRRRELLAGQMNPLAVRRKGISYRTGMGDDASRHHGESRRSCASIELIAAGRVRYTFAMA